jgi:hypothetical protein
MLSRPVLSIGNREVLDGRESTYKKQEVKTPSPGTPKIA